MAVRVAVPHGNALRVVVEVTAGPEVGQEEPAVLVARAALVVSVARGELAAVAELPVALAGMVRGKVMPAVPVKMAALEAMVGLEVDQAGPEVLVVSADLAAPDGWEGGHG